VTEPFRLWILHALWLALDGGHPQPAHVGTVLSILSAHTLHDMALRNPTVTQAIARCIHAMMPVMGAELSKSAATIGSPTATAPNTTATTTTTTTTTTPTNTNSSVARFLTLWHHVRRDTTNTIVVIETLAIIRAFIQYAPGALERSTMLPIVLTAAQNGDDVAVRRAAIHTLRMWTTRDPWLIVQSNLDQLVLTCVCLFLFCCVLSNLRSFFDASTYSVHNFD
jgi:hypothetical protein